MSQKLERSFLISHLPDELKLTKPAPVREAFLVSSDRHEVSVKQFGRRYYELLKTETSGKNFVRLSRSQFESIWANHNGQKVEFERFEGLYDSRRFTVDRYLGSLSGLDIVTASFKNKNEASKFEIPHWFSAEISYDPRFQPRALAYGEIEAESVPRSTDEPQEGLFIGAIPFLLSEGEVKVVTVTSRKTQRIIFPKGQPEMEMKSPEIAKLEALEEAGVVGEVVGPPVLLPGKRGSHLMLFPFRVDQLLDEWMEKSERSRRILSLSGTLNDASLEPLHPALSFLDIFLAKELNSVFLRSA